MNIYPLNSTQEDIKDEKFKIWACITYDFVVDTSAFLRKMKKNGEIVGSLK